MSDSEEDYMSDKLLASCAKDVHPGLLFTKSQKRRHELYKKQQEERTKKPKTYREEEQATREKGLSTAISSDNKGFKMLEKMGYKAGSGIGKSVVGIAEPLTIKTKDDATGMGRESHVKELLQKRQNQQAQTLQVREDEFKSLTAEKHQTLMLEKDYRRAQSICEDLDAKLGIEAPQQLYFWSKKYRDSLKKDDEESNDESEEDVVEDEEEEDIVTEPKLCDIIMYLRRQFNYCMYCGDYVEQKSVSSCPGYFRKDHDE